MYTSNPSTLRALVLLLLFLLLFLAILLQMMALVPPPPPRPSSPPPPLAAPSPLTHQVNAAFPPPPPSSRPPYLHISISTPPQLITQHPVGVGAFSPFFAAGWTLLSGLAGRWSTVWSFMLFVELLGVRLLKLLLLFFPPWTFGSIEFSEFNRLFACFFCVLIDGFLLELMSSSSASLQGGGRERERWGGSVWCESTSTIILPRLAQGGWRGVTKQEVTKSVPETHRARPRTRARRTATSEPHVPFQDDPRSTPTPETTTHVTVPEMWFPERWAKLVRFVVGEASF